MVVHSLLRIEVLDAFVLLTSAISNLCGAIMNEPALMAWTYNLNENRSSPTPFAGREQTCLILSQLHYHDNQAPREIMLCPGFIGASPSTIKLAIEVNECKERFKKAVLALKADKPYLQNQHFKQTGLSRLHLKQCYRKIPILNQAPQKISWTWAHTRSIKKISINKAQELLLKRGNDAGIEIQLAKLNALSPQEPLAIVQELAPHLRANLVFVENNNISRKMIKGPIPLFFPCDENTMLPEFTPPSEKCEKDKNRLKRSDEKLDMTAYLPAIRAHRYLAS